jgi:hypothetical protein
MPANGERTTVYGERPESSFRSEPAARSSAENLHQGFALDLIHLRQGLGYQRPILKAAGV